MRWTSTLALISFCLAALPGARADDGASPFVGTWQVQMTFEQFKLPPQTGTLVLANERGAWNGTLTLSREWGGRTQTLSEFAVEGAAIGFRVSDPFGQDVRMEGKLENDALSGRFIRKNGPQVFEFPWKAVRAGAVERFEKGLTFTDFLPKGDASGLGMDGPALDMLIREAQASDTDALIVLRDGHVVAERYFGRPQEPIELTSTTQFFTALAVAMLVEDKKLPAVETPVSKWFPDWKVGERSKVTLRHLLTHTSGMDPNLGDAKDEVDQARLATMTVEPGTQCRPGDSGVMLLSGICAKAAGRQIDDYLGARLFAPLSVRKYTWPRDGAGATKGYSGLTLTAREVARVAQRVADGGRTGSKQVLAQASIEMLGAPATPLNKYQGLLWTLTYDDAGKAVVGYGNSGRAGQWIVVIPKSRLVGVRLRRPRKTEDPKAQFLGFDARLRATAK